MLLSSRSPSLTLLALVLTCSPALAQSRPTAPTVPGFIRFYSDGKDPIHGGQLLFNELRCARCHTSSTPGDEAPDLRQVGARVKPAYLLDFLSDPQKVKPGTTMPNLLAGVDNKPQVVEALTHYLASTAFPSPLRPDRKSDAAGRELFRTAGCVACHAPRDAQAKELSGAATTRYLGDLKAKYTLAGLKAFLENPHKTRPSGRMPGILSAKEAGDVANYLLQGASPGLLAENMTYAYYELGNLKNLPDFEKLKPKTTGKAADFDLSAARRSGNVALKFDGYLKIGKNGNYTFHLNSDDGSKLWIDGNVVVNNDGIHPPQGKSGKIKLTKGMHKLTLAAFNAGGGFELTAEIQGPGLGRQPLAPWVFLTDKAETAPPKKGPGVFVVNAELASKGKQLFANLGCAQCHALPGLKPQSKAPALANLKSDGGCLQAMPKAGTPWYSLNDAQRKALAAALKAGPAPKRDAKDEIAFTMTAFNCYACHQRDKIGGVEKAVDSYFEATFKEWGDEARMPPDLTGVGAKLNLPYLKKVIEQGSHDRNYMKTHMPGFGGRAAHLAALLESVDIAPKGPNVVLDDLPTKIKSAGRNMVGRNVFGCINCHNFGGVKTEGVQGIDMAIMTQRLRKEWFHNYMLNPTKYRPGTRMPTSFPDGMTPLKNVLGGDANRQIEAIWIYLADGKAATVPFGMTKKSIPLVPISEAIIYRNFIQGAGPRAIGVGFPEKANLAFDANDIRLAMIWQGAFIDARRHWSDRGVGFEPPLGDNVLHLPAGATFAPLSQPDEPWPAAKPKDLGYKFLGYRLSDDERPTFLYSYKNVRIEDFPNASETKKGPIIRRTYTLTADDAPEKLYLRAAVGSKIVAEKDGWYRINDWRMRIESDATPVIRQVGNQMELLVPVRFKNKTAKIVQEYAW